VVEVGVVVDEPELEEPVVGVVLPELPESGGEPLLGVDVPLVGVDVPLVGVLELDDPEPEPLEEPPPDVPDEDAGVVGVVAPLPPELGLVVPVFPELPDSGGLPPLEPPEPVSDEPLLDPPDPLGVVPEPDEPLPEPEPPFVDVPPPDPPLEGVVLPPDPPPVGVLPPLEEPPVGFVGV
jgi:hypothetical protein